MSVNPGVFLPDVEHRPQQPFKLFAALFVWHESDIIYATVKNLLAEGCDKVFIIDNGSPDNTVSEAVRAGAVHWDTRITEKFSEAFKCRSIEDLVHDVNKNEDGERMWWLFCDADEFPSGPYRQTIRQYLESLDDRIRCAGANWLNHFPKEAPCYISGFHPVEFQPEANANNIRAVPYCSLDHAKHNLLRYDLDKPFLPVNGGYHRVRGKQILLEPVTHFWIHHVHWREPEFSQKRIKSLAEPGIDMTSRIGDKNFHEAVMAGKNPHYIFYVERLRKAEAVYTRKDNLDALHKSPLAHWMDVIDTVNDETGKKLNLVYPSPSPCTESFGVFGTAPHSFSTWYTEEDLIRAVKAASSDEPAFQHWYCRNLAAKRRYKEFIAFFHAVFPNCACSEDILQFCVEAHIEQNDPTGALEVSAALRRLFPASKRAAQIYTMLVQSLRTQKTSL